MAPSIAGVFAMASLFVANVNAAYQIDNSGQIKQSARSLAYDLMLFYHGNKTGEIPGILPGPPAENKGPYYWWQGGAMMGAYIDYWHYTGDDSYNQVVMQGMLHQVGEDRNYMPQNHTRSLGNDDQAFWGMSAMLAAENKFPDPPKDKPQWLALAQAVWNTQADPQRHDATCGGGMRWQIPAFNTGYDYKNTISNACFLNLGARLARFTGNATYARYASETWDWLWEKQYIDNNSWQVYDGAWIRDNCTERNKLTFSYNSAVLLQGAAFMYNFTEEAKWKDRIDNLLPALLKTFFPQEIAFEPACETSKTCTPDMLSFKGYVARWMAQVTQLAPHTRDKIMSALTKSTQAAVKQCTGGESGRQCGFYWSSGQFVDPQSDKTNGAGEAMNVLSAVSTLLVDETPGPVTKATGGTSQGDVNAGNPGHDQDKRGLKTITTGDRVGAGFLTILMIAFGVSVFAWISIVD